MTTVTMAVSSSTDATKVYQLELTASQESQLAEPASYSCTCPDYQYRARKRGRFCKHLTDNYAVLQHDWLAAHHPQISITVDKKHLDDIEQMLTWVYQSDAPRDIKKSAARLFAVLP